MVGATGRSLTRRALHILGAVAMFVAGVYLIDSTWVDLGVYLESGRYGILGYTLAYAATIIAFTAAFGPVRTGIGAVDIFLAGLTGFLTLLAIGFVLGVIAIEGAFVRDPPISWAALLAVPAVQCLAAVSLFQGASAREPQPPRSSFVRYVATAFHFVAFFAALYFVLAAGYVLWALLKGLVLDGRLFPVSRLPILFATVPRAPVVLYVWSVLVSAAGMTAISVIGDVFGWLGRRVSGDTAAGRQLDQAEADFVSASADRLRAFAKERGFYEVSWSGWASFGLVVIVLATGFAMIALTPREYSDDELGRLGWHLYVTDIGVSSVLMLLAGIVALILPGTVLASLSEKYAEAAGWTTIAKDPHHAPEEAVKRAVEARKLSATEPFDPGAFLRRLNMPSSIWAYILASMIVVALPFFWIHDKSRYFLLTDDYVEVMDYWTLAKQRYTYDRVERVDLGCSDDDAAYEIVLPGLSVDVLDRSSLRARFRDVEHVDGKIGSGAPRNLPPISYRDYPRCIERIVRDFDEDDAAAAAEIFRLEAWQRQRWIERTGKSERH